MIYARGGNQNVLFFSVDKAARQLVAKEPKFLGRTVSANPVLGMSRNYAVTLGALQAPPEIAVAYHIWWQENRPSPPLDGTGEYVLVSHKSEDRLCRITLPGGPTVLSSECLQGSTRK